MSRKIRCGVLGLGRLGYWHAVNATTRLRNVDVISVCDVDINRAKEVANELGTPNFTDQPEHIFGNPTIDAVIIATPTSTHFNLIKMASEANKAIFVEKPLTIDLNEAKQIVSILNQNHTYCQIGFMRRFDPAYREAKKRIDAGDIGKPIYFKGISRDPDVPHAEFVKHSGGIFIDVSIHDFDIARHLINSEVTAVSANGSVIKHSFIADYNDVDQGLTYLEFSSGAIGDVEASRNAYYGYDIRTEIVGTEGSIFIGNLRHHNINVLTKNGSTHDILPSFPERFEDAYFLELQDFFEGLVTGAPPKVTADDGLKALEVSVAARDSFLNKQTVLLDS